MANYINDFEVSSTTYICAPFRVDSSSSNSISYIYSYSIVPNEPNTYASSVFYHSNYYYYNTHTYSNGFAPLWINPSYSVSATNNILLGGTINYSNTATSPVSVTDTVGDAVNTYLSLPASHVSFSIHNNLFLGTAIGITASTYSQEGSDIKSNDDYINVYNNAFIGGVLNTLGSGSSLCNITAIGCGCADLGTSDNGGVYIGAPATSSISVLIDPLASSPFYIGAKLPRAATFVGGGVKTESCNYSNYYWGNFTSGDYIVSVSAATEHYNQGVVIKSVCFTASSYSPLYGNEITTRTPGYIEDGPEILLYRPGYSYGEMSIAAFHRLMSSLGCLKRTQNNMELIYSPNIIDSTAIMTGNSQFLFRDYIYDGYVSDYNNRGTDREDISYKLGPNVPSFRDSSCNFYTCPTLYDIEILRLEDSAYGRWLGGLVSYVRPVQGDSRAMEYDYVVSALAFADSRAFSLPSNYHIDDDVSLAYTADCRGAIMGYNQGDRSPSDPFIGFAIPERIRMCSFAEPVYSEIYSEDDPHGLNPMPDYNTLLGHTVKTVYYSSSIQRIGAPIMLAMCLRDSHASATFSLKIREFRHMGTGLDTH